MSIYTIVQESDSRSGRVFDLFVLFLIVTSILTISIETLPGLSQGVRDAIAISDAIVTVLFTIEYALRIATSKRKWSYVFSFYGVIDLLAVLPFYLSLGVLAVLPFYLSLGVDLRALRICRLFRVLRAMKLNRYSHAMETFGIALRQSRGEFSVFFVAISLLLYLSAMGIYYFEHEAQPDSFRSVFHCLWWAIATLTTVGYGDVYPITTGGRVFTSIVVLCGLGVVAVPTGIIAAALTRASQRLESGGGQGEQWEPNR